MNGNYIFRFKQTAAAFLNEINNDVPVGGNALVESHPDIIVRVLDPNDTHQLFESACYFNVFNMQRIDLCFPEAACPPILQVCSISGPT